MSLDFNKIKMIISDVDGVWTDGSIYKGSEGIELKKFSVLDGAAVALLRQAEIGLSLISGRKSDATKERAEELRIEDVYNGTLNKIPPFEAIKKKYDLSNDEIAYVGDDLIDIPVMEKVALPIATENASIRCKEVAYYVTKKSGGNGAFREAVEWILSKQNRLEKTVQDLRKKVEEM